MKDSKLEIGDVVYTSSGFCRSRYNHRRTITRLTKTQAISEDSINCCNRFKICVLEYGYVKEVGGGGWRIENEEIKKDFEKQLLEYKLRREIEKINPESMDAGSLKDTISFLEKYTKGEQS